MQTNRHIYGRRRLTKTMSNIPTYPPRDGDLTRNELVKAAEEAVRHWGGHVDVHFKFTCAWCGERCMLQEPNKLYENGECHRCGKETPITYGGFCLVGKLPIKHEKKE